MKRQTLMAQIAYNKACEALRNGKQAMVFVHSRKDTVKTAKQLAEFAAAQDGMELFSNDNTSARLSSRNKWHEVGITS